MNIIVVSLLSLTALILVAVWLWRQAVRFGVWLGDLWRPRGVTFGVADVPLSEHEWKRFAAFATARGVAQKTLLAEAVKFYLQEKVK